MHDLRTKIHCDFPCFVAFFISLFILVGLGSQLLDGWKHPIGGLGMTLDLEEKNSVQDESENPH